MPMIIGIAGGSGAGKTTVSELMQAAHPNRTAVVHLDDYFLPRERLPIEQGMRNMDHPAAINWPEVARHLRRLAEGHAVPRHGWPGHRIPSAPTIIIEGHMLLWSEEIPSILSYSIFLNLDPATRPQRRTKLTEVTYVRHVLLPMHERFIEPTKSFADATIDVAKKSAAVVVRELERTIRQLLLRRRVLGPRTTGTVIP